MLVDFMIIGAQKSGTTNLAGQLAAHPEICFSRIKEPGHFNRNEDWQAQLDQYHALFEPAEGQICGESSTMYTFLPEWQGTHCRLFAYNPNLKLIYIMRQPVERIISNYAHRLVRGTVSEPPEKAVFADPAYINRSRYGVQIRPYLDLFDRENILLLLFEEYVADQLDTLEQIARFLGVAPERFQEIGQNFVVHSSVGRHNFGPLPNRIASLPAIQELKPFVPETLRRAARNRLGRKLEEKPEFSPALRATLWRFLEDDLVAIETLMGRRLDTWRQGYSR